MPPQCCRCNGSGRCRSCFCVKNKQSCTNCLPGKTSRCENWHQPTICQAPVSDAPVTANDHERTLELPNNELETQETEIEPEGPPMADNAPDDHYQTNLDTELLPSFAPMQSPTFRWGDVEGVVFVTKR